MRIFVFVASAKIPEREGIISPSKSHVFYLLYQVDEFSFKETRKFLCFFGSNVGILNIIMLIQILFYQDYK